MKTLIAIEEITPSTTFPAYTVVDNKHCIVTNDVLPTEPWDSEEAGRLGKAAVDHFKAGCRGILCFRWFNGHLALCCSNKADAVALNRRVGNLADAKLFIDASAKVNL